MANKKLGLDDLTSVCKRRGFIFQSSEIYGGFAACWDYGPLGVELKNRVRQLWWDFMVRTRDNVVGMDGSILMHPEIWVASGHVGSFHDPLVDCKKCKGRFRADKLAETPCPNKPSKMVGQHEECDLTEPRQFNLMFKTHVGPVEDESNIAYLRPETAQAIFANYKNIQQTLRMKVPFGIAQVGKAFRNEITTQRFTFRSREFDQMEMQFFVAPDEDEQWFDYWLEERQKFYQLLGIAKEKLGLHEHGPKELAHYAKRAIDIEFEFPFGMQEVEGIHNRNDFDLSQHAKHSGKDLTYFDDQKKEKYLPKVIETSAGLDRLVLAVLCDAFTEEEEAGEDHKRETRSLMKFHPRVAPITVAVFPLLKKEVLAEPAKKLEEDLRKAGFYTFYDLTGSIGKRYRRMDEIGTPFCATFDFDSLEDHAVTIRDRDTLAQDRIGIDKVEAYLKERIDGE
jgi:glycyl-tRNA synthetase